MAGLELLSDQGYRIDGRRAGELRKIQARMGVFAQADGSAYIEQGNTKALAVVYGPHEASKRPGAGFWDARRESRPKPYGLTPLRNGSIIISEVPQPPGEAPLTPSSLSSITILTSWREENSQTPTTLFLAFLHLLITSFLLSLRPVSLLEHKLPRQGLSMKLSAFIAVSVLYQTSKTRTSYSLISI